MRFDIATTAFLFDRTDPTAPVHARRDATLSIVAPTPAAAELAAAQIMTAQSGPSAAVQVEQIATSLA